jgi:UDP-N-acetylglucosamine--N-acetylmuramyl-(pentapeptide) pyrophosphoryl-undecaprenol N-acetylglucosamine transferase
LRRSASPSNLGLPIVVRRASTRIAEAIDQRDVRAVLGMGGYATIPTGLASRRERVPFFVSEQNARAGLASRIASHWAARTFGSFQETEGLAAAEWVGNPVRRPFWEFDRDKLRPIALERYGLDPGSPIVGVIGGSLGSAVINQAIDDLVSVWEGPHIQVVHIVGERFFEGSSSRVEGSSSHRLVIGFEASMEQFYAAADLVIARSGGAVAELTATATPSILIPGQFGSGGHQEGNARFIAAAGAAVVVPEADVGTLPAVLAAVLGGGRLAEMAEAARHMARPRAAHAIADAMLEAAG